MSTALVFAAPLPGLEAAEGFTLRGVPGADGLFALEATNPQVRMFVADASVYVPDYAPAIPGFALEAVGLAPTEGTTLVVVNPSADKTTVNLMAPIVLNPSTGTCIQVILDGGTYPLRAELGS
ncbi:flagellar assembly protein FliW [Paenarthrobacter sp. NPDC090522]|uniref:flagellar assembly protein FliW n=1 Tax=Paenarthrobacter sp. NPDC090522 TaxID=3364383 RepID=UPI00380EB8B9